VQNTEVTTAAAAANWPGMSSPSDQSPPPTAKPKLSVTEQKARREDKVMGIRLRMAIGQELDAKGITTPAEIGEALGMPAAEEPVAEWPGVVV
jgi:hypothetical protein